MNLDTENPLVEQFARLLERATGHSVAPGRKLEVSGDLRDGRSALDHLLCVRKPAGDLLLAVKMLRQGYPRDIRNAVWQLEEYRRSTDERERIVSFVIADFLSSGAREILRERGIGFFDASGSLFLKSGDWLVDIERPAKASKPRRAGSIYNGARERVVHALLHAGHSWLTGLEIAALAKTSPYTVSQTLVELERLEWWITSTRMSARATTMMAG